jgi:peptide deformylase
MAVRRVLQATESRGEAVLRRHASKVKVFDADLQRLADDMFESMHAFGGVGLAAPQIGMLQRLIVIELPPVRPESADEVSAEEAARPRPGPRYTLCNPEFAWRSEELEVGEEGCLSLAGWYALVPRSHAVEVRYQDLHGRRRKLHAEGYLARVLQHEVDHLEGILFTDQVEDLTTLVRLNKEGEEEPVPLEMVPATPH